MNFLNLQHYRCITVFFFNRVINEFSRNLWYVDILFEFHVDRRTKFSRKKLFEIFMERNQKCVSLFARFLPQYLSFIRNTFSNFRYHI